MYLVHRGWSRSQSWAEWIQQLEAQRFTLGHTRYKSGGYRPGNFLSPKSSHSGIGKVQEKVDTSTLPSSTPTHTHTHTPYTHIHTHTHTHSSNPLRAHSVPAFTAQCCTLCVPSTYPLLLTVHSVHSNETQYMSVSDKDLPVNAVMWNNSCSFQKSWIYIAKIITVHRTNHSCLL